MSAANMRYRGLRRPPGVATGAGIAVGEGVAMEGVPALQQGRERGGERAWRAGVMEGRETCQDLFCITY